MGVLVNHTYPLYDLEEKKNIWGRLKLNDEDDKEEQDGTNVEQNGIRLRQTVHEQFFDGRVLFCDSFKDGLTFGGAIDWSICFALFPTKVIQKVFFAGSHIVIEDILTKNNKFRFIVFKKQETIPAKQQEIDQLMIMFKETHELFEERLAALFRVRAEKDSGFLTKFVWLCTGSRFIPNIDAHPDYKITIEYNHTDKEMDTGSLPVMHTCAKLMKIPMYAYNADIEEFEMKVNQTAEYVEKFWFDQA